MLFSPRIGRWLRIALLVAVPLTALVVWLSIQPATRMATPDGDRFFVNSLLYDEFDLSAMALRGLNAVSGRQAGRLSPPEDAYDETFHEKLLTKPPLEKRYFLEYPHAILLLFRSGWWLQPSEAAAAQTGVILDSDYHNLAIFRPHTPEQSVIMRGFVRSSRYYVVVMVICLLALIAVLEWGYGPRARLRGGALMLLLPAAIFFTLNRYDVIPALCTALSFALLGRDRHRASAFALAVGVLFKVYPILFAPFVLRYLWTDRKAAIRWATTFAATGLLAFMPLLFGADLQAVLAPYLYQFSRPPEPSMTIYGCLLPEAAAGGAFGAIFRLGTLGVVTAALLLEPITSIASILRRSAMVLVVFVSLAVFYSPQWILWFAPLLLPLVAQSRRLGWTIGALDAVTYMTFPIWYWLVVPIGYWLLQENGEWNIQLFRGLGGVLRLARFAVCGVLAWQLLNLEWPKLFQHTWLARRVLPALAQLFSRRPM